MIQELGELIASRQKILQLEHQIQAGDEILAFQTSSAYLHFFKELGDAFITLGQVSYYWENHSTQGEVYKGILNQIWKDAIKRVKDQEGF